MTRPARLLWATGVLAALSFAILAWLSITELTMAGGLGPFDERVFGYDADTARAYLASLSEPARAVYLGRFRLWDTIFPGLLAFTLCGVIWINTGANRRVLALAPLPYLAMDYRENALVAELLRSGGSASDQAIADASLATQAKWGLLALAAVTVVAIWRLRRGGRA